MKTKDLLATIFMLLSFTIVAQESDKKEMKPFEIEKKSIKNSVKNLKDVFSTMFKTAKFEEKKTATSCKPEDLVNKIHIDELKAGDEELVEKIATIKDAYLNYPQHLTDALSRDDAYSFETGAFARMEDAALNAFNNTNNFADFVKMYTGKDVGYLNEYDLPTVRGQYNKLKENSTIEFQLDTYDFMSLSCGHEQKSYIKLKNINYPNATWVIRTEVSTDCDCSISSELTKNIKSGTIEYTAETTGLLTTKNITFSKVTNAKVSVKALVCCPVDKETSSTAVNDSNDDSKGYFQVGAFIGLPLGEEKDFYSLNIGADVAYLYNLSDRFSAGAGVGYSRFTGKDVDFGSTTFEGEGTGFVPIFGTANYAISDKVELNVYAGYALSTESEGDGGFNYGVGVSVEPIPGLRIQPEISFIGLGEDRHFNSFRVRVSRSW